MNEEDEGVVLFEIEKGIPEHTVSGAVNEVIGHCENATMALKYTRMKNNRYFFFIFEFKPELSGFLTDKNNN